MSQGYTTEGSNYSFDPSSFVSDNTQMYSSRKRSRSNSYASGSGSRIAKRGRLSYSRIPRSLASRGEHGRVILPLTYSIDYALNTDVLRAFAFDTGNVYTNGGAAVAIPGATEIAQVYELARIVKIEFTILPSATDLGYPEQTVTTGSTNIPYIYHCADYNDMITPTLLAIQQSASCKLDLLNKPVRRTIYPKLEGSNGIIDLGQNQKNIFCNTGVSSTQRWHGFKIGIDMTDVVWSYSKVRVSFKIFYECTHPK